MRHLSNIYDPERPDAKRRLVISFDESRDEAWERYLRWLSDKAVGRPKATEHYTVEQLEAKGYVGVYSVIPGRGNGSR